MTKPTLTQERDRLADQYGRAVNQHYQERMPQSYITGEPRPWLDRADVPTSSTFRAGFDAATAIFIEREKIFREALLRVSAGRHSQGEHFMDIAKTALQACPEI